MVTLIDINKTVFVLVSIVFCTAPNITDCKTDSQLSRVYYKEGQQLDVTCNSGYKINALNGGKITCFDREWIPLTEYSQITCQNGSGLLDGTKQKCGL